MFYQGNSPRWRCATLLQGYLQTHVHTLSSTALLRSPPASPILGGFKLETGRCFLLWTFPWKSKREGFQRKLINFSCHITSPIFRSQIKFGHFVFIISTEKRLSDCHPKYIRTCHSSPECSDTVGTQSGARSISSIFKSALLRMKNILCPNCTLLLADLSVLFISQAV